MQSDCLTKLSAKERLLLSQIAPPSPTPRPSPKKQRASNKKPRTPQRQSSNLSQLLRRHQKLSSRSSNNRTPKPNSPIRNSRKNAPNFAQRKNVSKPNRRV